MLLRLLELSSHQASLLSYFWSFACHEVVYLINILTTLNLKGNSPYEIIFQDTPKYEYIKVVGCLCYLWLKTYTRNKLEPHSTPYVYLGFSNKYQHHQCFDPINSKVYFSRAVLFLEDNFPFENMFSHLKNVNTTDIS